MEAAPFVLAAVAAAVVAWFAWRAQQRRREQLFRFATLRGWHYRHHDHGLAPRLRGDFALFRAGNGGRRCENVIDATTPAGAACTMFDYRYEVRQRSGANDTTTTRTVRHAVALARLPAPLPELRLAPENLLTRVASAVGFRDVEVESPAFNRRFRVSAASRAHAFDLLHPRSIEFLLAQRYETWDVVRDQLLITVGGRWGLEDYDRLVAAVDEFVALVPGYVWSRHAGGKAPR